MPRRHSAADLLRRRREASFLARKTILGLNPPAPIEEAGPRYSLVIFDLDGTLVDSSRDIAAAVNDVRAHHKLQPLPIETVRSHIGWRVAHLLQNSIPEVADLVRLGQDFLHTYRSRLVETTTLFPGALDVLSSLVEAGVRIAVATNKPEKLARELLRRLGVSLLFIDICGGDRYPEKKPHPRPLLELHERFGGTRPSLMVGDSMVDAQAATAAGLNACLVNTPTRRPSGRSEVLRFLDSLEEVLQVCRVPELVPPPTQVAPSTASARVAQVGP